jgi:hypothetical protein
VSPGAAAGLPPIHDDWSAAAAASSSAPASDAAKQPEQDLEEGEVSLDAATGGAATAAAADEAAPVEKTAQELQLERFSRAVEKLGGLVERFALRMINLMDLGVLALPHAETMCDICRDVRLPPAATAAVASLKEARRLIDADEENGGADGYFQMLDIDVREVFFRIQVLNGVNTYGGYRPLPAALVQDFKGMLDSMRLDYIVEAVHLYEQAYPQTLGVGIRRVIGRFVLEKMELELAVMGGAHRRRVRRRVRTQPAAA